MEKNILILFFIILNSLPLYAYIDLESLPPNNTILEITVNSNLRILGGQKLLMKIITAGDQYEYILNASTGNEGYPSPDFIGNPLELKETHTLSPFNYELQHAIFYSEENSIYAMPLTQFHTSNEGQRSGADCLTEGLACTRGNIGLWPNDAKLIFDIVKKIGFKNTTIKISKDSTF